MAKSDWSITGSGGLAIVDDGGSKRCQLSGIKLMLWNGRNDLIDSEVDCDFRVGSDGSSNNRGGMVLRSDITQNNCYRLDIYGGRTYYIRKIVDGIVTTLATISSTQPWNIYLKTRFRIDAWQLSVEEYISGIWQLVQMVEETSHARPSGYAGLHGFNYSTSQSVLFDNVKISEKT